MIALVRAIALIAVGALLIAAGLAGPTDPTPTTTPYRPATEAEQRQWERQLQADLLTAAQQQ